MTPVAPLHLSVPGTGGERREPPGFSQRTFRGQHSLQPTVSQRVTESPPTCHVARVAAELATVSLFKLESPDMERPITPDALSVFALPRITHLLLKASLSGWLERECKRNSFYSINGGLCKRQYVRGPPFVFQCQTFQRTISITRKRSSSPSRPSFLPTLAKGRALR